MFRLKIALKLQTMRIYKSGSKVNYDVDLMPKLQRRGGEYGEKTGLSGCKGVSHLLRSAHFDAERYEI